MKIITKEFNISTGEETIIERDETPEETKARLDHAKEIAAAETQAQTKATEKAALLAKLGITADEAALLLS
jgi:hypothetical protein